MVHLRVFVLLLLFALPQLADAGDLFIDQESQLTCKLQPHGQTLLGVFDFEFQARDAKKVRNKTKRQLNVIKSKIKSLNQVLRSVPKSKVAKQNSLKIKISSKRNERQKLKSRLLFIRRCIKDRDPLLFQDKPTPTPTLTPTATPTPVIGPTATPTASSTPTPDPTPSITATSSPTPDVDLASFVNFESPHIHPLELGLDGQSLFAVNTSDAHLEVFDISSGQPEYIRSISVGVDPVTVRNRSATEIWVVNHISDSVSIIDLNSQTVVRTLQVGDAPTDLAFSGSHACIVISGKDQLECYLLSDLSAAPVVVNLAAKFPYSISMTADQKFIVSMRRSGNQTALVPRAAVSDPDSPYAGQNPAPNAPQGSFQPSMSSGIPGPPQASLIVRRNVESGLYLDSLGADWTPWIAVEAVDHDIAVVDANNLEIINYLGGALTNGLSEVSINPGTGRIHLLGSEAKNEMRFEPNLKGRFITVQSARYDLANLAVSSFDLNPHLNYSDEQIAAQQNLSTRSLSLKSLSFSDPRAIAWRSDGSRGYALGLGSNSLIAITSTGTRDTNIAPVTTGLGPTGLAIDQSRDRIFILNRFDASLSSLQESDLTLLGNTPFFDATPQTVKLGRKFLYDTQLSSELGHLSCASCHIDARKDDLAWDLGDPRGEMINVKTLCSNPSDPNCGNFELHPMKGPFATQTLAGISGTGPLHWRGDKSTFEDFNGAFSSLLGRSSNLSAHEMALFKNYVDTISFPPQPNRTVQDQEPASLINGGSATRGRFLFGLGCNPCHSLPTGTNKIVLPPLMIPEAPAEAVKIPHQRNLYTKLRADKAFGSLSKSAFGFLHDGAVELSGPGSFLELTLGLFHNQFIDMQYQLEFGIPADPEQMTLDLEAFLLSFPIPDIHSAIGKQLTFSSLSELDAQQSQLLSDMLVLGLSADVALSINISIFGQSRTLLLDPLTGLLQTDRRLEVIPISALLSILSPQTPITVTAKDIRTYERILDRDGDGCLDQDELDAGSNPLSRASIPAGRCQF